MNAAWFIGAPASHRGWPSHGRRIATSIRLRMLACWLAGCLAATPALAQIVIGQVSPQDGYLGFYTRQIDLGAETAFKAVNARGGVLGQTIRFVTVDDRGDPQRSLDAYASLAARESPVAFLYHVGPDSIVRLLKEGTLDKLQVPLLGTIPAIDPFRTPVRPFVFHLRRGDETEIATIARHLVTIGLKRLSVLYLDDPAGRGAVPIVQRELDAAGGTLVLSAPVAPGSNVSDETLAAMRRERTQATLLFMPAQTAGAVVARLRPSGLGIPVYSVSYLDARTLVASAGLAQARGVAISQAFPSPAHSRLQIVRDFRRDIAAFAPEAQNVSPFTLEGYIAARVLIEAVRATGKSRPTGRDVQAALARMDADLGGLTVRFPPESHVGLNFIDIAVVGKEGELMY